MDPITEEQSIGSIKYTGNLVAEGFIDALAGARALNGLNDAFSYFLAQEDPTVAAIGLPLPVHIRKGSWEALIPTSILGWMGTAIGAGITSYITVAAKKLAENGYKDETLTTLAKKAITHIQTFIRLGKHLGHIEFRKVTNIRWENGDILIPNEKGDILRVPQEDWNKLARAPANLISDLAQVIEEERSLIVTLEVGKVSVEVAVSSKEKSIFTKNEEDTDTTLFPHLVHGAHVELSGLVTRENGRSKTLGFLYEGHILTCLPASGNMLPYKKHLYLNCTMSGTVSRIDETGQPNAKRPKIIFDELAILNNQEQLDLLINIDDDEH